jgi:hypothetical protein
METAVQTGGTTFIVSAVKPETKALPKKAYKNAVENIAGRDVESCSAKLATELFSPGYHPFIAAVEQSFNYHLPLILSPDHLWLLICQGVANHINVNSEALRKHFVPFEGKQEIKVRRDDFVRGAMENPWEEVWPEFISQMGEFTGPTVASMFDPTFSTTGNIEKASCQVVLMDAMQSYFEYTFQTMCGIPSITLEGEVSDWQAMLDRVGQFAQYGLEKWVAGVKSVLSQFVAAAQGNDDEHWWQSFYKLDGGSGGPFINGHVMKLFPYLMGRKDRRDYDSPKQLLLNDFDGERDYRSGNEKPNFYYVKNDALPCGLSKAPFVWQYFMESFKYEFLAGFVGVSQRDDGSVRPEIGWAVSEVK